MFCFHFYPGPIHGSSDMGSCLLHQNTKQQQCGSVACLFKLFSANLKRHPSTDQQAVGQNNKLLYQALVASDERPALGVVKHIATKACLFNVWCKGRLSGYRGWDQKGCQPCGLKRTHSITRDKKQQIAVIQFSVNRSDTINGCRADD